MMSHDENIRKVYGSSVWGEITSHWADGEHLMEKLEFKWLIKMKQFWKDRTCTIDGLVLLEYKICK